MVRRTALLLAFALRGNVAWAVPARADLPPPLARFHHDAIRLASHLPGAIALDVLDLNTGYHAGFNAGRSMPAASTIKLPVMVEVFNQLQAGRFDLNRRVTLHASDRDYGSGVLCDARVGSSYAVSTLLEKMIVISDNTATNMLIRLVGRPNINREMAELGLAQTHLAGYVRTDDWAIRRTLRTSAGDLVRLLSMMARGELVDTWSSKEMISILEADTINTLLPAPLPDDVAIAHKTGSFFDTLNDAGIVYAGDAPYVIAVMTTALHSQGRRARIHPYDLAPRLRGRARRRPLAYDDGLGADVRAQAETRATTAGAPPDVHYWGANAKPSVEENAQPQTVEENAPAQSVEDDAAPTSPPTP